VGWKNSFKYYWRGRVFGPHLGPRRKDGMWLGLSGPERRIGWVSRLFRTKKESWTQESELF
jgi:hypothetical protein